MLTKRRLSRYLKVFSKSRSRKNLYDWFRLSLAQYAASDNCQVINIGAGGELQSILYEVNVNTKSVDIDSKRNPDFVCDVEDLKMFSDSSVDVVCCMEVLEHVMHPEKAVSELFRVLRSGGVVIGSTPFLLGIHDEPRDFFRYTSYGLRSLFHKFKGVVLQERNGYFAAVAALLVRPFVVGTPREKRAAMMASPILIIIVLILELFDRAIPLGYGTTGYFYIFEKP